MVERSDTGVFEEAEGYGSTSKENTRVQDINQLDQTSMDQILVGLVLSGASSRLDQGVEWEVRVVCR